MKVLLITDIHYGEDTNYPKLGGEAYANSFGSQFELFLPKLKKTIASHDLVINLGDLIHETTTEQDILEYKKALSLLHSEVPVKNVIGNHDVKTLARKQAAELIGENNLYYSFDFSEYHHVVLEGFREEAGAAHEIGREQLEWLAKDLAVTELPVIVYCHFPLDDQSLESNYYFSKRPDRGSILNREEVRGILEQSKKVICVFNGHLHFYNKETINGITYITVPSFTENDGEHKPKAQCLSVSFEGSTFEPMLVTIET